MRPTFGEVPGGDVHALTRGLLLVLRTMLVLLCLVKLLHGLVRYREQHVALVGLVRHFLHSLLKDLVILRQDVHGLHGLLVEIVHLGVRLGVLLVSGA